MNEPLTISIREASSDDISVLYALYDQMGQKDAGYFEKCFEEQDAGKRVLLIASLNGKDAGFCILNRAPRYALYQKLGIPEIQDLNVIPDARRCGVAKALIAECEIRSEDRGYRQIGVSVGLGAAYGPAQHLYWSLGYQPDGQGVSYDRKPVAHGQVLPVDDDLCLMLVKDLQPVQTA